MSNERIDLKHYENKYTFETPIDPNWNGAPWTTADLKVILDEVARCYERIDNAESTLREIWDRQINCVGGYNVTEILQYYKNAHGLNIEPEEE